MDNEKTKIEKIRESYLEKELTKLEELKKLDKRAKYPAKIFAYVYGSLSSLVLGVGMCLAMNVLGAGLSFAMPLGICVGILGIILVSTTYSIYQKVLKNRKEKYSSRIIKLSDSLLNK